MMQAGAFGLDDDYAFSVLLAHAHMDASHLWYALADKDQTTAAYRAYSKHIDAAHSLPATACTQNENHPIFWRHNVVCLIMISHTVKALNNSTRN